DGSKDDRGCVARRTIYGSIHVTNRPFGGYSLRSTRSTQRTPETRPKSLMVGNCQRPNGLHTQTDGRGLGMRSHCRTKSQIGDWAAWPADDARQAAARKRRLQAQIARSTGCLLGEAPGGCGRSPGVVTAKNSLTGGAALPGDLLALSTVPPEPLRAPQSGNGHDPEPGED